MTIDAIIALDPALKTGFALWMGGKEIVSGTKTFHAENKKCNGLFYRTFRHWLASLIANMPGDVALGHETCFRNHVLTGVAYQIEEVCDLQEVERRGVNPMTLKKFATGSGKGTKKDMQAFATGRAGREIVDPDEADALCVLAWMMNELGVER